MSGDITAEDLRIFKGTLVRDYNQKMKDTGRKKEEMVQLLNKIIRMEVLRKIFTGNLWSRCWNFLIRQIVF